jgi:hypothetical protein
MQNGESKMNLKTATIAAGLAFAAITPASAGYYPMVGDQFKSDSGQLLTVVKRKLRPDVDDTLVCMREAATQSCVWRKVGDLRGDWITYQGEQAN